MRAGPLLVLTVLLALPLAAIPSAAAAADGSTTVLVLDVSGSMDDPDRIPPDFPQAARLQADEDAVGRLLELAHPGRKVPLSVIAGGLMGLPELISLRSELDSYLQQHNVDPASISKLAALKLAASSLLTAIQLERDRGGADDRVGIVTFSSDSTVLAQPTTRIAGLAAAVQGLQTDGSTNIGAGLQSALDLLGGQPNPSIILMTDGWNNDGMTNDEVLSGAVRQAAAARIPVCAIGIGETPSDVDQRLLIGVASRTGGGYHFVGGGAPLGGDLLACHHSLAGQSLGDVRGSVRQGQAFAGPGFDVPAGRHRLTVTLSWPGSQLDMRVTDPAGKAVGSGYPGAAIARGPGYAVLTVTNPAPGHWGLGVVGIQTAAGGEQFVASASTEGTTASPHRDALVGSVSAPLDDTETRLQLARTVSAAVAVLLVAVWLVGLVTRPLQRRRRPVVAGSQPAYVPPGQYPPSPPAAVPAPAPAVLGPAYTPPPPSGYALQPGQPAYVGAASPVPASQRQGCLGCVLWLVFALDLLVLGSSAAALYLWTTPLLTFPG